ncbi:MAG: hypothetical protein ACYCWW_02015 [Deltaproteobacteria bacterium]
MIRRLLLQSWGYKLLSLVLALLFYLFVNGDLTELSHPPPARLSGTRALSVAPRGP